LGCSMAMAVKNVRGKLYDPPSSLISSEIRL
jgi:hypothetical protein